MSTTTTAKYVPLCSTHVRKRVFYFRTNRPFKRLSVGVCEYNTTFIDLHMRARFDDINKIILPRWAFSKTGCVSESPKRIYTGWFITVRKDKTRLKTFSHRVWETDGPHQTWVMTLPIKQQPYYTNCARLMNRLMDPDFRPALHNCAFWICNYEHAYREEVN